VPRLAGLYLIVVLRFVGVHSAEAYLARVQLAGFWSITEAYLVRVQRMLDGVLPIPPPLFGKCIKCGKPTQPRFHKPAEMKLYCETHDYVAQFRTRKVDKPIRSNPITSQPMPLQSIAESSRSNVIKPKSSRKIRENEMYQSEQNAKKLRGTETRQEKLAEKDEDDAILDRFEKRYSHLGPEIKNIRDKGKSKKK